MGIGAKMWDATQGLQVDKEGFGSVELSIGGPGMAWKSDAGGNCTVTGSRICRVFSYCYLLFLIGPGTPAYIEGRRREALRL